MRRATGTCLCSPWPAQARADPCPGPALAAALSYPTRWWQRTPGLTLLWVLLAAWCACCAPAISEYPAGQLTMGTTWQMSLYSPDAEQAARAQQHISRFLDQAARDWYAFGRDQSGELQRLNHALAAGETLTASAQLTALLITSQHWHQRSAGFFDPAVAPLTQAWGFGADPPTVPDVSAWQHSHARLGDLLIQGQRISSQRRDLQVDLSAIGKGYALDQIATYLQQAQLSALLNLGGQVLVVGTVPAARREMAIRAPRENRALAMVSLHSGESMASSGDYERAYSLGSRRIHHLLDPHTGEPVPDTQAVTVIAATAAQADAASTALMAAGEQWRDVASKMGIRYALRVDAAGTIEVTAALYARLRWATGALPSSLRIVDSAS